MAVGVTIGHPCTECQATMEQCDLHIKEHGRGCCGACFMRDTHGLLDKFKVIDVADQQQDIENLHRLVAQMVLARSEHANAIRQLRAEVGDLIEQVAFLRGDQEREDELSKRRLLAEVVGEVRTAVQALPERVKVLEMCIEGIEARLGLRRKAAPGVPLPPPEEKAETVVPIKKKPPPPVVDLDDDDEPRRRWWPRRSREDDGEGYWG